MRFEWDPDKDQANRLKHGLSFSETSGLFTEDIDFLEIYDEEHSGDEDRFIAIGPIERGVIVAAYTEPQDDVTRIFSARMATPRERKLLEEYWRGRDER